MPTRFENLSRDVKIPSGYQLMTVVISYKLKVFAKAIKWETEFGAQIKL